jgi:hypothetical protein
MPLAFSANGSLGPNLLGEEGPSLPLGSTCNNQEAYLFIDFVCLY